MSRYMKNKITYTIGYGAAAINFLAYVALKDGWYIYSIYIYIYYIYSIYIQYIYSMIYIYYYIYIILFRSLEMMYVYFRPHVSFLNFFAEMNK